MRKLLILSSLIVILASSCTVTENIAISGNKTGSSVTDISVQQYFIDVLTDFSAFMPEGNEDIMDSAISSFSSQLASSSNASAVRFVKTSEHGYTGYFDFSDFTALAAELAGGSSQSIISQTANSVSFHLDINNYEELEKIVPFLADPNIEVFLAKYNIGYSEQDYLDMIVFSLGEEAPESLTQSYITIQGTVPGTITSISGATRTGSSSFTFSFPLIDFLLLAEPIDFSVTWR